MKIAYFDCYSGIAGDMVLGALLDAGLDMSALSRSLKKINLKGYELKAHKVRRGELTGTKFDCLVKDQQGKHAHRSLSEILKLIDESSLKTKVKKTAKDIFNAIGRAEGRIHGVSDKKSLHLHELSDIDSIIDIVGTAIAIEKLGIDEVHSSAVTTGRTFVKSGHGTWPIPAPASIELLKGVPLKITELDAELVTPTGAGILKHFPGLSAGLPG